MQKIDILTGAEIENGKLVLGRSQLVLSYEGSVLAVKPLDSLSFELMNQQDLIDRAYIRLSEAIGLDEHGPSAYRSPTIDDAMAHAIVEVLDRNWERAVLLFVEKDENGEDSYVVVLEGEDKVSFYDTARIFIDGEDND